MDPERWRRVGELFHRALEHDAGDRARFLDGACGGDPELRAEIESLLAHHEDGTPRVAPTPPEEPTRAGDDSGDERLDGRRLGPYRVIRKLGEGGMGMVHLAEDSRLGRRVAIKVLPPPFTRDEPRRRRLRREARAAASLAHPGIATVYALEEFDGALCIVSEYVPGETLRQELAGGPLPPADLLDTAVAVARALAAAHEGHVLHRDLKPENVIRTPDPGAGTGGVKLVDFGLARYDDPQAAAASATRLTAPGAVLGTPGYMAPEQIRGEEVDSRTDVFAFGVMLFELASGRHPFSGSNSMSTVARVLESPPPDLRQLAPACPPALAAVIDRCLRKDPAERYGATRELVDDLERARRHPASSAATPDTADAARDDPPGRDLDGRSPSFGPAAGTAQDGGTPGRDLDGRSPSFGPSAGAAQNGGTPGRATRLSPVWWWQFHQRAVGAVYYALLYPLWQVREWAPAPWGSAAFFAALAAVLVAANLRFHLSFTERFTPAQLDLQQAQVAPWIRTADWVLVAVLLAATALIAEARPAWASLTAGAGVVSALTFLAIEPATTRAAFRDRPSDPPA